MAVLHMLIGIVIGSGIGYYYGIENGRCRALIALMRLRCEQPTASFDAAVREALKL